MSDRLRAGEDEGVVEKIESLAGAAARLSLRDRLKKRGKVKGGEFGRRRISEVAKIDAPMRARFVKVSSEVDEDVAMADQGALGRLPKKVSARCQHPITKAFGVEAPLILAGQPEVFLVPILLLLGDDTGSLVGFGENDGSNQLLRRPSLFDERDSEVIKKLRMSRAGSIDSKVVRSVNKATSEEVHPDSIHEDSRGLGMLWICDPFREGKSPTSSLLDREV